MFYQNLFVAEKRRLTQVDHRYMVSIAILGDAAVVPVEISLGIGAEPAHSAGAGVFQIWI